MSVSFLSPLMTAASPSLRPPPQDSVVDERSGGTEDFQSFS